MEIILSQEQRPCLLGDKHALLHGFYVHQYSHGTPVDVGGGQESHAMALIELEDGSILDVYAHSITMLDSEKKFKELDWGGSSDR